MKKKSLFPIIALFVCLVSASGQKAVRDTIFIYENVIVFDTIVIRDTVRIKDFIETPVIRPKGIDKEKIFSPLTATFSEKYILSSESTNEVKSSKFKVQRQKDVSTKKMNKNNNKEKKKSMKKNMKNSTNNSTNNSSNSSTKNSTNKMASFLSAAILTTQSISGILAQDTTSIEKEPLPNFPMQVSFVYPISTMGAQTVDYRYGLSLNVLTGKVGAVSGVEFGGIYNHVINDVYGIQFGGIGNRAGDVEGIQYAGWFNIGNYINGIQFGGIANVSNGIKGVQFGGITNINASKVNGIQFGGIANIAENVTGAQFAGIVNLAEKVEGAQFAGIGNISNEVTGICFGGIFNRTEKLQGVLFAGIVNVVDTVESGIPFGFINIVKKGGYKEFSVNFADYMNVGLSFKMGIRKFYTIFSTGANFLEDKMWMVGYGVGNRTTISPRFDVQPEIMGYQYFPWDFKNVYHLSSSHLKVGIIYKFNERLGVSVAPSLYLLNGDKRRTERVSSISPIAEWDRKYSFHESNIDVDKNIRYSFGAGICVGLLFN